MNPTKVVVHEVESDRMAVVLNLLGKGVSEPRKPPHRHAHRQVLALHETGRYMLGVGNAADSLHVTPDAGCRAVASIRRIIAIDLVQHGIVRIAAERLFHGL